MTSILLIEDDITLSNYLSDLLKKAGYLVEQCFDGEHGFNKAKSEQHHLVLLDKMLPKLDGVTLLKQLRQVSQIPVIMVSAKGAEEERILGFTHGADDYVAKPFNSQELLLRIESLLRRAKPDIEGSSQEHMHFDGLSIDVNSQQVHLNEILLDFTPIQFKLLWNLLSKQNVIIPKAELHEAVLNKKLGAYDRSIDMHLSRVRRKLNEAGWQGDRLQTVHGKGYCFK